MVGYKNMKRARTIGRAVIAILLNAVLLFGVVFNLVACGKKNSGKDEDTADPVPTAFVNEYPATTQVGYYGRITNTNVPRTKPTVDSEKGKNAVLGVDYPRYGTQYKGDKDAAIAESERLVATGTKTAGNGGGYNFMDENGNLFSGTRASYTDTGRDLYKHVAAVDNYHGNVNDSEPAVEKVITMRDRGYDSYNVTGIYAPAGEVIKIQISEKDMNATNGITVHIGQCLYDGRNNNIWAAAGYGMTRMPHLMNTMAVNKNTAVLENGVWTAYVGSFLGGPIYIRNNSATFTATISGGVEYPHFILGYTTEAEYNRLITTTSAPYFDLEVWDHGVLLSGPRIHAEKYSYDELYQAAILWEKVSSVSTQLNNWGIVFLFDSFVAAGAAVSFGGSVNCPEGWMSSVLNYNQLVTSGDWGDFHEYHHNFQGFGVGGGGEVTNNSMTLVSYALFTKISASRSINNFGGDGLGGGWNRYTSATWALEETLKIKQHNGDPNNGKQGLPLYATLLHNFGPDNFVKAAKAGKSGGQNYQNYMTVWEKQTHNNMYYYFNEILDGGVSENSGSKSYPMFVPVSSVYQTGRSYIDGETDKKQYIKTMQPYQIKDDEPFTVDLGKYTAENGSCTGGSIVIPDGFTYTVKNVTQPERGSIDWKQGQTSFTYTPESGKTSGEIKVTLGITKDDNAFKVDDVDLVLEFQPTKELNKLTLERTIYTYADGKAYAEATDAFNHNFEGYESKKTVDHSSPGQNVNTDIWFRGEDSEANRMQYPNDPDHYFTNDNQVHVIDGKLYFESDGKYRVYLRARFHAALYFSLNGTDYELGGKIASDSLPAGSNGLQFRGNDPNTYFDIEFNQGKVKVYLNGSKTATSEYTLGSIQGGKIVNWLYIKEVLIVKKANAPQFDYIGVGMKKWDKFQYNITMVHYNASGTPVADEAAEGYAYTVSTYKNGGTTVAEEKVYKNGSGNLYQINRGSGLETVDEGTFKEFVETPILNTQPYANAYRRSYEFPDNSRFESDYFYKREHNYGYTDNVWQNQTQTLVSTENYSKYSNSHPAENLVDGDRNTFLHTSRDSFSEENPLEIVIDMGSAKAVNRMTLYNQTGRSDLQVPTQFKLYGSLDGEDFFLVHDETAAPETATQTFSFEEKTFRYYKLVITKVRLAFVILGEIEMWRMFEVNGQQVTPDSADLSFVGDWSMAQTMSTFGKVYVGKTEATLSFEFTGERLGILSSTQYGKNFEVYIDGKKVDSIALKEDDGFTVLTYLSDALENKLHRVEIRCLGETNIDSIVTFA